jgi:hypothetical protein
MTATPNGATAQRGRQEKGERRRTPDSPPRQAEVAGLSYLAAALASSSSARLQPWAMVGQCVLTEVEWRAWRRRRSFAFAWRRLSEIERLILLRHRGPYQGDDGEPYLMAALPHLAALPVDCPRPSDAREWARTWCPALVLEHSAAWFAQLDSEAAAEPRRPLKADEVAAIVRMTAAERRAIGATTIGAVDMPKRERTKLRKEAKRAREERRRRAAGAKSRRASVNATRPWVEEGISRRTWFRRRAQVPSNGTVSCPA